MATKTIPQLTETTNILDNGVVAYDSGAQTFKTRAITLKNYVNSDTVHHQSSHFCGTSQSPEQSKPLSLVETRSRILDIKSCWCVGATVVLNGETLQTAQRAATNPNTDTPTGRYEKTGLERTQSVLNRESGLSGVGKSSERAEGRQRRGNALQVR